ncbi:Piwi-domain-containing protein [Mytilinidion resinicola]|uniref:Piwi-domain-containing protein n=1 Tax=Mytilinidion resinicola TaxID=574789 RepID=A0A6A6ZBN1_9PEZI|nr:Piwi-domain-containing protein [Mytilinidion resinicola]KAF2817714.1 Piwi-domain-containing protein [Mytilinidion resinicola]
MRLESEKGAVWVPASCLEILPMQPVKIPLNSTQTSDMISAALRSPGDNARLIVGEGLKSLGISGGDGRANFVSTILITLSNVTVTDRLQEGIGFNINTSLVEFIARILPSPRLSYDSKIQPTIKDASWHLKQAPLVRGKEIAEWPLFQGKVIAPWLEVIYLRNSNFCEPEKLGKALQQHLTNYGIKITNAFDPEQCVHQIKWAADITLRTAVADGFNKVLQDSMVLVILPNDYKELYSTVKREGDSRGILNVCCLQGKYGTLPLPPMAQKLSNLALKFNLKHGKDTHRIEGGILRKTEDTIVMGADVGHPPIGGADGSPSIAAVVGSLNHHMMNYPGSVRLQAGGQEIIGDLKGMVSERLQAWNSENGKFPTRVLFYRDGVSDSQFKQVKDMEINAIRTAYKEVTGNPASSLELTFVVVGKRHHTRFYAKDHIGSYKDNKSGAVNGNLRPGLVVDQVVTLPGQDNFFLQSHAAVKGTARSKKQPTSYATPSVAQPKVFRTALPRTLRIASANVGDVTCDLGSRIQSLSCPFSRSKLGGTMTLKEVVEYPRAVPKRQKTTLKIFRSLTKMG